MADSRLPRNEIYIATKISSGESHGYAETKALVARQLSDLQTSYIDLYYIHGHPQPPHDVKFSGTWRALEELVDAGVIRHLGVSNYNEHLLRSMFEGASASQYRIKPSVIQVPVFVSLITSLTSPYYIIPFVIILLTHGVYCIYRTSLSPSTRATS